MTRKTSDSTRYIIQVGNNRFRRDTWDSLKDICSIESTPMADEIWCALDAHVRAYAEKQSDAGDGSGLLDKGPRPDFSLPENDNIFDKMVDDMVAEAAEEEVEEVVHEERRERGRMASSDMFGHYRKK
jgi:hypothetical protein